MKAIVFVLNFLVMQKVLVKVEAVIVSPLIFEITVQLRREVDVFRKRNCNFIVFKRLDQGRPIPYSSLVKYSSASLPRVAVGSEIRTMSNSSCYGS